MLEVVAAGAGKAVAAGTRDQRDVATAIASIRRRWQRGLHLHFLQRFEG